MTVPVAPEAQPVRYTGSCHCGKVAFEVEGTIDSALACNCSMCRRRGSLLWFVPHGQFRLTTPEADLDSYTFHKHVIAHRFCPACGIHTHGEGTHPAGYRMAAVNLRTLDGVDLDTIPVHRHDGLAM